MIVWKGWGILALLIPAVLVGGGDMILKAVMASKYMVLAGQILLLFASAAAVWLVGSKLNNAPVKYLRDPETGKIVYVKPVHSLFWIPMQWFAVLWAFAPAALIFCS